MTKKLKFEQVNLKMLKHDNLNSSIKPRRVPNIEIIYNFIFFLFTLTISLVTSAKVLLCKYNF